MQENGAVHSCVGESMDNAVADLAHPNVSNRYHGNTPEVIIEDEDVNWTAGSMAFRL
jgi:hypothetical protein